MTLYYEYTPYIWPMLASAGFNAALGLYAWRRRKVPGALPFAILMLFMSQWAMGAALELAAIDIPTKIFWFKFQYFWQGPVIAIGLWFVLEYAQLNRFLTRRNLILLFAFPLAGSLLILTNDAHHWIWLGFSFDQGIQPLRGSGNWILTSVGILLTLMNFPVLIWLFIRSPQHRWPAALILCGQLVVRAAYVFDVANVNPFAPMDPTVLATNFSATMYAISLFGFRMFDPIPVARRTVIEQMQEGMLVLDMAQKIVDLNLAAEKLLGFPAAYIRGRDAAEVLPAYAGVNEQTDDTSTAQSEIELGTGATARYCTLHLSPLKDRSGHTLGYLILLHDMTEQKRAQAQLMEQQRALAALKEREQVARELHDELSQELAFINLQAQAASELLTAGETLQARAHLARLAEVARETQVDVREQISKLSLSILPEEGFIGALRRFLEAFHRTYEIQAELIFPEGQLTVLLEPTAEVQLLRIVQEAFTNIRKHACARSARVSMAMESDGMELVIEDDGNGFDLRQRAENGETFGLRIMRERAAEIGGSLQVESEAGRGTRVIVRIPIKDPKGL